MFSIVIWSWRFQLLCKWKWGLWSSILSVYLDDKDKHNHAEQELKTNLSVELKMFWEEVTVQNRHLIHWTELLKFKQWNKHSYNHNVQNLKTVMGQWFIFLLCDNMQGRWQATAILWKWRCFFLLVNHWYYARSSLCWGYINRDFYLSCSNSSFLTDKSHYDGQIHFSSW